MYTRILVPVDGSAPSNRGLEEALKLAKLTGAQLLLLHVVDELSAAMGMAGFSTVSTDVFALLKEGGEQVLKEARVKAEGQGIPVQAVLVENFSGRLCDVVAQQVKSSGSDLLVLGSHGRRGVGRLVLGSDAEQIIRTALVPVLVVRAQDEPAASAA